MRKIYILLALYITLFSCEDNFDRSTHQLSNQYFVSETKATYLATQINDVKIKLNSTGKTKERTLKENVPIKDENGETIFYIINYELGGFIILSADNRISPILAYSDHSEFHLNSNSYPSGLVEWLLKTKEYIQNVRDSDIEQSNELKAEWDNISVVSLAIPDPEECTEENEEVTPLLSTEWNQTCGYNSYMPLMNCTAGCASGQNQGRAYAGCVPVAIAQVMKYHNYPNNYNWSLMPNLYGSNTTSSLIKDIHDVISLDVDINYECDVTGVDKDYSTAGLFTNHFSYSTASQGGFNSTTVKNNLRNDQPVILGGGRNNGWWIFNDYTDGHMWVCDGFRRSTHCLYDDYGNFTGSVSYFYLHMNWGWGGQYNGWYSLNNFNPGGNSYNYQVKMIYNINP